MAILVAASIVGLTTMSAQGQDGSVTFDVGEPQGIDSMSPLAGFVVPAFEAWNMQYATLTDKAAKDFSHDPRAGRILDGLEGQEDLDVQAARRAQVVGRQAAHLRGHRLDREHRSQGGVDQPLGRDGQPHRHGSGPADGGHQVLGTGPQAPHDGRVHPAEAHLGQDNADERETYEGVDGVGSGPFVLEKFEKGQFARFKANPNYWGGKPKVDKVVLRKFNNPDAMVAALKTGELDAAWDIPGAAFNQLKNDDSIVTNEGYQGGFAEVAINGGDGLKKPHPALDDIEVRKAIAHAIDKKTLVDRVLAGVGKPAETIVPSPDNAWLPELSEEEIYEFDLDKSRQILDDAGYKDTDGDGVREMPGGGRPLNFKLHGPL